MMESRKPFCWSKVRCLLGIGNCWGGEAGEPSALSVWVDP